jgi:hypothetical protein
MAGGFQKFLESVLKIKVQPNSSKANELPIAKGNDELINILSELTPSEINTMNDLNTFRQLSSDRETQYQIFDEMEEDTTISSALEIYADDSTQYNTNNGKIIWAESDDNNAAEFANHLITLLRLNENAWSQVYSLCHYGDLYLETFQEGDEDKSDPLFQNTSPNNINLNKQSSHKLASYIEQVSNPAEVFDIVKHGKTVGFVRVPASTTKDNTTSAPLSVSTTETVYDPRKFVHIYINSNPTRVPETITLQFKNKANNPDPSKVSSSTDNIVHTYSVRRGKSVLADIYKTYQEIKLMEDSLLLNRITRSSIIRIMQVEVGDMNKSGVANMLKRLKQMMEQRNIVNKTDGTFKSLASPGPVDNIIYVPTRNGKGVITTNNVGGDVDVKGISDVDYFSNKLYGGIKIPKGFLGQDSQEGSLSAGTSLTKLDARYARTIKRVQNSYIQGITNLINIFAIDRGMSGYVNRFTIKMQSPATTEDSERDESFGTKTDIVGDILNLIDSGNYSDDTKKAVLEYMIGTYIGNNDLAKILSDDKPEAPEEPTDDSSDSSDIEKSFFPGESGPPKEGVESDSAPESAGNNEEPAVKPFSNTGREETPEAAPDNGFGNF